MVNKLFFMAAPCLILKILRQAKLQSTMSLMYIYKKSRHKPPFLRSDREKLIIFKEGLLDKGENK